MNCFYFCLVWLFVNVVVVVEVVDGQVLSQSVTKFAEYSRANSRAYGASLLTFKELIRQRSEGNQVQQCPCVRLPGSDRCITYDSRFQAASIEEAILTFPDTSMDARIYDDRINQPIGSDSLSCRTEECRQCAALMAVRLRQLNLINGPPTFSFRLPTVDNLRPDLCRRLRLSRTVVVPPPPGVLPGFMTEMIRNGLARRSQASRQGPVTALGLQIQQTIRAQKEFRNRPFFEAIMRARTERLRAAVGRQLRGQNSNNGNSNQNPGVGGGNSGGGRGNDGPGRGQGGGPGRGQQGQGGGPGMGQGGGNNGGGGRGNDTPGRGQEGGPGRGQQGQGGGFGAGTGPGRGQQGGGGFGAGIGGGFGVGQGSGQQGQGGGGFGGQGGGFGAGQQGQGGGLGQGQPPRGNRPPPQFPPPRPIQVPPRRFPTSSLRNFFNQFRPGQPITRPAPGQTLPQPQPPSQPTFPQQPGQIFPPQPPQQQVPQPQFPQPQLPQPPQGQFPQPQPQLPQPQFPQQQFPQGQFPQGQTPFQQGFQSIAQPAIGQTVGSIVENGVSWGASGAQGGAAGGHDGGGSGFGGSFGFGGGGGRRPGGFFGRKKRAINDKILGDRFVISCVERGDKENEETDFINLCTRCWTWRQLPPDYFPRLINELVCQENDYCLSGWGACQQRFRNVDVLRKSPGGWQPTTVSVASCCDCKVKAGSEVHALVIGGNSK